MGNAPFVLNKWTNNINLSIMKEVKEQFFVDYSKSVKKDNENHFIMGGEIWYN